MAMQLPVVRAYSVSDVTRYLGELFETDGHLQDLWVRGEISNLSLPSSGHAYFSLKDEQATLRCVMYRRSVMVAPRLTNGMEVFAHGHMAIYEPRGEMQLIVEQMEDAGIGVLYQRFTALRDELEAAGLFDPARKRPIPYNPKVIGIVTSPNAAALRDIIRTMRLRWPLARAVLAPTLVQGTEAPDQIVRALKTIERHGEAEVVILARGGGSIEDLWAFNERTVAQAIAASRIPIVTGIGHETDFTIADFVADLRAATPTAAAVAVTPDLTSEVVRLSDTRDMLIDLMRTHLAERHELIEDLSRRLDREHPRAAADRARQQVDDLAEIMHARLAHRLDVERERLSGAAFRLQALSPLLTIARGYAVVTREDNGAAITSIANVSPMETVAIRLSDGRLTATVTGKGPV